MEKLYKRVESKEKRESWDGIVDDFIRGYIPFYVPNAHRRMSPRDLDLLHNATRLFRHYSFEKNNPEKISANNLIVTKDSYQDIYKCLGPYIKIGDYLGSEELKKLSNVCRFDISRLEPGKSSLWKNMMPGEPTKSDLEEEELFPKEDDIIHLKEVNLKGHQSPKLKIYYIKDGKKKKLKLKMGYEVHTDTACSKILELAGLNQDIMKYYPKLKVYLGDSSYEKFRSTFANKYGVESLIRYITAYGTDEKGTWVLLHDLVLEARSKKEMRIATMEQKNKDITVVVGMSGGVDSSVAALLLKQQGYNVVGVFMKNWEERSELAQKCSASKDWQDVSRICSKLDIPYYSMNFTEEYYQKVFIPFLEDYKNGLTPNPDILCNKEIKFKAFFDKAMELGADFVATGHYCNIEDNQLLKAKDGNKDQTYFLYAIDGACLEKVKFPLGTLEKKEVREIAKENGLCTYDKKDSTGICFIGERNFREFMGQYIKKEEGDFCLLDGTVVGKHQGTSFYTIGQRRQLGLGGEGSRWFVVKKDLDKNIVYVTREENHPLLYSDEVIIDDLTWLQKEPSVLPYTCSAKIRYRQEDQECQIEKIEEGKAFIHFFKPQKAVALRQSVVFYQGDICLGGGMVLSHEKSSEI